MFSIDTTSTRAFAKRQRKNLIQQVFLAIGTASLCAGPALAQGDWSGIYVGAHLGSATGEADWVLLAKDGNFSDRGFGPTASCGEVVGEVPGCSPQMNLSSAVAGAHLGWQRQLGAYVLGAEASVSFAGLKDTTLSEVGAEDDEFTTQIESYQSIIARAGWVPPSASQFLVFATAGIAGADVKTRIEDNDGIITSGEVTERHNGWTAGAGVEYMLRPNVLLGLEYKHFDLGSIEHEVFWDQGDVTNDDVKVDFQTLAFRVSYKF